jgi:hypothetical protein
VSGLSDAPVQPEALPDWLHTSPNSKLAQVYRLLVSAGSHGITNVDIARWGIENYCTSAPERVREINRKRPGSVVTTRGATRGTWIYRLERI